MNKVIRMILLIILALVLLLAGCSAGSESTGTQVGERAPDFQLQSLNGQTISLSDLRGEPVLLNFWATWCGPCVSEMPHLEQIYQEWSNKGLVLWTIDIGESSSQAQGFMQYYNLSLPVLLDTQQRVAQKYSIMGIPSTFFIDKDGIIQGKKVGAFLSEEEIEQYLREIMP